MGDSILYIPPLNSGPDLILFFTYIMIKSVILTCFTAHEITAVEFIVYTPDNSSSYQINSFYYHGISPTKNLLDSSLFTLVISARDNNLVYSELFSGVKTHIIAFHNVPATTWYQIFMMNFTGSGSIAVSRVDHVPQTHGCSESALPSESHETRSLQVVVIKKYF